MVYLQVYVLDKVTPPTVSPQMKLMISFASWIFDVCSFWHELANGELKFKCIDSLSSLKVEGKSFATFRCSPASPTPYHLCCS